MLNSLTLMLYLLVPWTALNLVDFFFVRRGHYAITDIFRPDGVYGAWGWRGPDRLLRRLPGRDPVHGAAADRRLLLHRVVPDHVTNGVDYSWLVGLAVSGLVYWLASRSLDVSAERSAIEASERELRAIDILAAQSAE